MSAEYFLAWLAVMFPLVFSPGPANIVFALSGIKQGFKKSIPLLAGVNIVFITYSLIIGFGLGEFLNKFPQLIVFIKLLGIFYLIYLVYKFIKPSGNATTNSESDAYKFCDGLVLQMLNPKGWTMLFLMFSLFLDGSFDQTTQVVYLVVMLAILNISTHITWVAAGAAISSSISDPKLASYINYFFAASLLVVALWLLIETLSPAFIQSVL